MSLSTDRLNFSQPARCMLPIRPAAGAATSGIPALSPWQPRSRASARLACIRRSLSSRPAAPQRG
eukprot:scaffold6184_cov129-Isochrysis_galbana.AAC.3